MKMSHAVGIDLGTTYSCIACLNQHGQPVTIPNQEGELATPSVVFLDGDEFIVGTEALRNAIAHPDRVVQNAKRFMGNTTKTWQIDETLLTPQSVSSRILHKLLNAATQKIGPITEAVITVPAQFSDSQRQATAEAGHAAGLDKVEVINEPVAAALCYVLGSEGIAFTELAIDQQLLLFDLGGGTLDLAVISYTNDQVRVVASDGDLELGGLDWTNILVEIAAERFLEDVRDDPRLNPESHQALVLEAEQAKRSLSVRPRAAVTVQHAGHRHTYQIEKEEFQERSQRLLQRAASITRRILKDNQLGWAHIDALLTTGGASRMPMIKDCLQKTSGRTLNSSLSPDHSIAHGAAYYAGMLLSNSRFARTVFSTQASKRLSKIRQQSVSARSLGIMVRDEETGRRIPHYLVPPNTPLPVSRTHKFGTVVDNQTTVRVRIVESGAGSDKPPNELGDCEISNLPPGLPEGTQVDVTISYDAQARVHVSARELTTNKSTEVEIVREEALLRPLASEESPAPKKTAPAPQPEQSDEAEPPVAGIDRSLEALAGLSLEFSMTPGHTDEAVLFCCNQCGRPLTPDAECEVCVTDSQVLRSLAASNLEEPADAAPTSVPNSRRPAQDNSPEGPSEPDPEEEFWDVVDEN
jgi:molecular chaperone DnaK